MSTGEPRSDAERLNVLEAFVEMYEPMLRRLKATDDRRSWAEEVARQRWIRWKFRLGLAALVITMVCTVVSAASQVLGR